MAFPTVTPKSNARFEISLSGVQANLLADLAEAGARRGALSWTEAEEARALVDMLRALEPDGLNDFNL